MQFYRLAVGARFEYNGKRYLKTGMDAVRDETGQPDCFRREWDVIPIGEPMLLSEAEAELWKPIDLEHWSDHLAPSPITRGAWGKTKPLW
jgi:hypothetical protein